MSDGFMDLDGAMVGDDDFYPGSAKKRKAVEKPSIEFIPEPWQDNFVLKTVSGVEVPMYTVGTFAEALGVSVPTIRNWTAKGYIPQAPYRLPSNMVVNGKKVEGRRLYTKELIQATVEILGKYGILGKSRVIWDDHPQVTLDLIQEWTKILRSSRVK